MRFFENGSKYQVKSDPFCNQVCPEVDTSRDFKSSPSTEHVELLATIVNNKSTRLVREKLTYVDGQDREEGVTFKKYGGATKKPSKVNC